MHKTLFRSAIFTAIAALSLALGLAGPSALARPAAASADHWRIVLHAQNIGWPVIATTPTSLWSFGFETTGKPAHSFAMARHWNGHRWSGLVHVSAAKNSYVSCAGSSSAANVWAFVQAGGGLGDPPSYAAALQLRNGRWITERVISSSPLVGTIMTGCNVLGPTDVWVFGGEVAGLGRTVGTWHLTRSGWRHFNTGNLVIFNASVVSGTDIWGAAADLNSSGPLPVLARWNGKKWREDRSIGAALPKPTSRVFVTISAVHALSANDVWVQAAAYDQNRNLGTFVVHWDGKAWRRVSRGSFGYYLPTAVTDGHGGWWTAPNAATNSSRYLLHGANGRWTRFALPHNVLVYGYSVNLSRVPHSDVMVANGFFVSARGARSSVVLASGPLPR